MVKVTYHWIYPTFDPGHSEMFFFCWKGDRTEQKIGAMKKKKGVRNVSRRQFRDSCDPKSILSTSKITTAKGSWRLVSGQRYAVVLMKLQNRDIAWRTIIKFDWNWADSCIHLRIVKSSTVYLSYVVWRVVHCVRLEITYSRQKNFIEFGLFGCEDTDKSALVSRYFNSLQAANMN